MTTKQQSTPSTQNFTLETWLANCGRTIQQSGLFDLAWYLLQRPAIDGESHDPISHYLTAGAAQGLTPNPLFDTSWYLRMYPDVAASTLNPLIHYILHGAAEGRFPNPLFDSRWYLDRYPDVAASGMNPLTHYLNWGAAEGRDTHRLFSTRYYLTRNAAIVPKNVNPLFHYLTEGHAQGLIGCNPEVLYDRWLLRQQQQRAIGLSEVLGHIRVLVKRPTFVVLVDCSTGAVADATKASLDGQLYTSWKALSVRSAAERTAALAELEREPGDDPYIVWVQAGDVLDSQALYAFAAALNGEPNADLVYLDEDHFMNETTLGQPILKPDWSPDAIEAGNFIGHAACFKWSRARQHIALARSYYDFVLRFTETPLQALHVKQILYHRRANDGVVPRRGDEPEIAALQGRLERTRRSGSVAPLGTRTRSYEVTIALARKPRVSVIVAFLDEPRAHMNAHLGVDDIVAKLASIGARLGYDDVEVISLVNAAVANGVRAYAPPGHSVIAFPNTKLSRAAILNLGARAATGELLLFLDPDLEPCAPQWVSRLVGEFEKPHAGAVGAKLLQPDKTTQHVGIVLNDGIPRYVRQGQPIDDPGYFDSSIVARNYIAICSSCLMTRAEDFRRVGGFEERLTHPLFADLDYGLKLRAERKSCVFVPAALLVFERTIIDRADYEEAQADYLYKKWGSAVASDPFYDEEWMTVAPPTFELALNRRG